jgi:hypothetical protein
LRVAKTFGVVKDKGNFLEVNCSSEIGETVDKGVEDAVNKISQSVRIDNQKFKTY